MAKVPSNTLLLLRRRAYGVVADNTKVGQAVAANKAAERKGAAVPVEKETYWMKDPKTGNWLPESQFEQIDAAELRKKLLPTKPL